VRAEVNGPVYDLDSVMNACACMPTRAWSTRRGLEATYYHRHSETAKVAILRRGSLDGSATPPQGH
jgi:hypothetical protein